MRIKLKEGQLFSVPVKDFQVLGLIARINRIKILAYFFERRFKEIPSLTNIDLDSYNVIYVSFISPLALEEGKWDVIGMYSKFKKEMWPIPVFKNIDAVSNKIHLVYYDESLEQVKIERNSKKKDIENLPEDGLDGYGFVEKRLARLLL